MYMKKRRENNTLTALSGIKVGHSTHLDKLTGCTVVVFDKPYPVAYKAYGGAPGTFNTDLLRNGSSFYKRWGLFVAGGSLTGLMSASEIMKSMIEKGTSSRNANIINPSISGAIVFDLGTRIEQFNAIYGREAFNHASNEPVANGNVGAGTGTAVGKFQYLEEGTKSGAMKAGVGSARINIGNHIIVCALSVVNALGNVVKPDGTILVGNRDEQKKFKTFDDTTDFVTSDKMNTTISIVGINIDLKSRENYERVAHLASHGQVRAINPVHTSIDGDVVFVFSTEEKSFLFNQYGKYFETPDWSHFSVDIIGNAAAKAVQDSIYHACYEAETIPFEGAYNGIIPAVKDYLGRNI
ncbi:P1 family peptidase [Shimazuella kribbensis]|uniref:P1 family peptidase n=1 Tax=Shimazuella kribbensis TaxID=139808 RepID=UPI000425FE38|nr:P1 family peptidase [Shimazuella kribbensis]